MTLKTKLKISITLNILLFIGWLITYICFLIVAGVF